MSAAHYTNMSLQVKTLDFRDTFLNWDHLQASFPHKVYLFADEINGQKLVTANKSVQGCLPPYILTSKSLAKRKPKKRAHLEVDGNEEDQMYEVDTYTLPYEGPYPTDRVRVNTIPFTATQGPSFPHPKIVD
jgi:intron-binding protein aquarius